MLPFRSGNTIFIHQSLLLLSLLLWSCDTSTTTTDSATNPLAATDTIGVPTTPEPTVEIIDSDRPICFLYHLSATSTAEQSQVTYLVDNDPTTVWTTRTGSGPDELYQLRLADHQAYYIEHLELLLPEDGPLFDIAEVEVYINGQPIKSAPPTDVFFIGQVVETITLRITAVGGELERSFQIDDKNITARQFPREFQVGLAELKLFGREGVEYRIIPPRVIRGSVKPSSNLNPLSAYHAGRLFDGHTDLAWVEGSEGAGEGDSIVFELAEPVDLSGLVLWNGFQASPAQFSDAAALRHLEFGPVREPAHDFFPEHRTGSQQLMMGGNNRAGEFVLRIKAAHSGNSYQDLAISELVLLEGEQPIIIQSNLPERFREELELKAKSSILGKILNRRVYNEIVTDDTYRRQSILLHSDATFNYFLEEVSSAEIPPVYQVGHGTWQIISAGEKMGEIELSGNVTTYEDTTGKELSRTALQDHLELSPDQMQSRNGLGTFYLY